jgi:hypothetical protein
MLTPRTSIDFFVLLSNPHEENPHCNLEEFLLEVAEAKKIAADEGNDEEAKELWKCQTIAKIQSEFIAAFSLMKNDEFYDAWCALERCEINIKFLSRHYEEVEDDPHWIRFIRIMVERWQSLFPYAVFFSPEFLKKKILCTICDAEVKPRSPCGHVVGNIYGGEFCGRKIVEVELLGIAVVESPVQKYSVAFTSSETGEGWVDHYDYSNVRFLVQRLYSPFHSWDTRVGTRTIKSSEMGSIDISGHCPCRSGDKYGECCHEKPEITVPHRDYLFAVPPPVEMPQFELCIEAANGR